MNQYIDVRGPWPVYFDGMKAYEMRGQDRSLTVEQAKEIVSKWCGFCQGPCKGEHYISQSTEGY